MSERILYTLLIGGVGVTVGYLAQRSRMCFVAGLRDYILVRDRELLTGLFSFLLTVWVLSSVFYAADLLEQRMPEYGKVQVMIAVEGGPGGIAPPGAGAPRPGIFARAAEALQGLRVLESPDAGASWGSPGAALRALLGRFFWTSLVGGALIGFLSVLAGGCVLRQHVLCAQGNRNALLFILGFYAAAVVLGLLFFDRLLWFYG